MQDNLKQNQFINFLKKIWPTIYRIINMIVYTIIMTIKNGVKLALQQLKGGG